MTKPSQDSWVYILDDVFMIVLAIISVVLLVIESTVPLAPSRLAQIDFIDLAIAIIFLIEFAIKWYLSRNRTQYFRKNWWILLASLPITTPATQALRGLRLLRLVRLLRLFRVITGTNAILDYCGRFFTQTHVVYVFVISALSVLTGAAIFDVFERGFNPAVHGFFDCLWWAMATVTTIGYGDIYPMTVGGRIDAMFLMIIGIGLSGVFTALVATFILRGRA